MVGDEYEKFFLSFPPNIYVMAKFELFKLNIITSGPFEALNNDCSILSTLGSSYT